MRFLALACLVSLAVHCLVVVVVKANPIESSSAVPEPAPEEAAPGAPAEEGSKMSKFLDDFTSAFKHGTAKMKESLESAASSVKDGVLQGYDYVRSKLTGDRTEAPVPAELPVDQEQQDDTEDTDGTPITSTQAAGLTSSLKPSPRSTPATSARPSTSSGVPKLPEQASPAIGIAQVPAQIVPNDDGAEDDRIFFNDKDLEEAAAAGAGSEGEREGTEQPVGMTTTNTPPPTVDNRFILAGPLACKTGQEAVNGKCRNVF